jgi:flagellar basal-body rod modification protein FlgD
MGKDDFMKLLVAQLEHQNPLEPLSGTEFTGQLAQFSAVEQAFKTNENLQSIRDSNVQLNSSLALNMIGKQVEADGNQISLGSAGSSAISFSLGNQAAQAEIMVYNSAGDFVTKITQENLAAGRHKVVWNGQDSNGIPVPIGNYNFQVIAKDAGGEDVAVTTYTQGLIDGIGYEGGKIYATIGDRRVPVDSITEIRQRN